MFKQRDIPIDRHTDRYTCLNRETYRQTDIPIDIHVYTERQTDRQTYRQTDEHTQRGTASETDPHKERQNDIDVEKHTDIRIDSEKQLEKQLVTLNNAQHRLTEVRCRPGDGTHQNVFHVFIWFDVI